jgi:hypothetical protein
MLWKVSLLYLNKVRYEMLSVRLLLNLKNVNFLGLQPIVVVRKHMYNDLENMTT